MNLGEVQPGDALLIVPGERIAVDGHVVSGHSYVDQAAITGESSPVEKQAGSIVYAGTVNQAGALDVVADRLGKDTESTLTAELRSAQELR